MPGGSWEEIAHTRFALFNGMITVVIIHVIFIRFISIIAGKWYYSYFTDKKNEA